MADEQPEEHKKGILKGEVRGVSDKSYTRNLSPANVFVKILVPDEKPENVKVYSAYDEKGLAELNAKRPKIYKLLYDFDVFKPHPVDKEGDFELMVPLGDWEYAVGAVVGNKRGYHLDEMGDDGKGTRDMIKSKDFEDKSDAVNGIIVPVDDRQWQPDETKYEKDPDTDTSRVPPGLIPEGEAKDLDDALDDIKRKEKK